MLMTTALGFGLSEILEITELLGAKSSAGLAMGVGLARLTKIIKNAPILVSGFL